MIYLNKTCIDFMFLVIMLCYIIIYNIVSHNFQL